MCRVIFIILVALVPFGVAFATETVRTPSGAGLPHKVDVSGKPTTRTPSTPPMQCSTKCLKFNPENLEFNLGQLEFDPNNVNAERDRVESILIEARAKICTAEEWCACGIKAYGQGQFETAIDFLTQALRMGYQMPTLVFLGRAYAQSEQANTEKAMALLTEAYSIQANDETLAALVSISSLEAAQLLARLSPAYGVPVRQEAQKWIEIGKARRLSSAYHNQGFLLDIEGEYEQAHKSFQEAWDLKRTAKTAFMFGMYALQGKGGQEKDKNNALRWFDEAIQLGPADVAAEAATEAANILVGESYYKTPDNINDFVKLLSRADYYINLTGSPNNNEYQMRKLRVALQQTVLIENNARQRGRVPNGEIRLIAQLLDWDGKPYMRQEWKIVAISRGPIEEAYSEQPIAQGLTSARGTMTINQSDFISVRKAIEARKTLVLMTPRVFTLILQAKFSAKSNRIDLVIPPQLKRY